MRKQNQPPGRGTSQQMLQSMQQLLSMHPSLKLADAPARADTPIAAALADVPARADKQIDAPIDAVPFDAPARGTPGAAGSTDAWAPVGMSPPALLPPPADRADALYVPLHIE